MKIKTKTKTENRLVIVISFHKIWEDRRTGTAKELLPLGMRDNPSTKDIFISSFLVEDLMGGKRTPSPRVGQLIRRGRDGKSVARNLTDVQREENMNTKKKNAATYKPRKAARNRFFPDGP